MGNLGDRIFRAPGLFRGYVVDWIGVVPRYYPIFNLADSAIVCGGILTVILAMRGYHLDGTRSVDERSVDEHGADQATGLTAGPAGREPTEPRNQRGRRSRERQAGSRPRGPGRRAARRGPRQDVRLLPDRRGRADRRRRRARRRQAADEVRPGDGRGRAGRDAAAAAGSPAPRPSGPSRSPAWGSCTRTTTSWWSTSPRGVAAHPTPGWTGPTVIGGLLGSGHRVATSGAAERQGIVHRLDANTTGVMVVAKSELGLQRAQAGVPRPDGVEDLPRAHPGAPRPAARHDRRTDRQAPVRRRPLRRRRGWPALRHALRHDRGVPRRVPAQRRPGNGPHPPDPGAHGRAAPPVLR